MYEQLKSCVAELIAKPRPLKPQTQRQLSDRLSEHSADLKSFLACAAEVLEDYELDVLFAPSFTPALEDQAQVASALQDWRPSPKDVEHANPVFLVGDASFGDNGELFHPLRRALGANLDAGLQADVPIGVDVRRDL